MAVASPKYLLAVLCLLLSPGAHAGSLGFESDTICGGPGIWRILTRSSTVEGVQNIQWSRITAEASHYIDKQQAAIKTLEAEIEGLDVSIREAMTKERPNPTTPQQLGELVHAASAVFRGVAGAQATMCGKPGMRPRQPRGATQKSQEAFKAAAAQLFNGEARLAGDFLQVCRDLLIGKQAEEGNYCVQLCQRFKDEAQQLSDGSVGALGGATSQDLMKQRAAAVEAVGKAKTGIAACEQAQETFSKLEAQLKDLKGAADERHYAVMDAEHALEDARWELDDLEQEMSEEEAILQDLIKTLDETGGDVVDAKKALSAVLSQEKALRTRVADTDTSLHGMQQKLHAAQLADKVIEELRGAVSAVAEKMHLLFDKAVLEPVRSLGIHETLSLDDYFHADAGALKSAGMVRETVDELDGFCKGDAQEAFHAVADQIDLSPLCRIGDAAGIKTELVKAVNGRVGSVRESIEKVKTWMDPFKGQEGITQKQVAEFVAKGEPEGLRRVMGVYSSAGFFQYLKGWEVRGDFLGRIAKLKQVIDALDSSVTALAGELKTFKDQYSATTTLREEAEKKLEKAVQVHGLAQDRKDKVEGKLAEMRGHGGKLKQSIEDLERAVELALKNWATAKQMMVDAYSKATSFLELLPEGEPSALLEAKTTRAQQQIATLRGELESAKTARAAIRAKMAAAKAF